MQCGDLVEAHDAVDVGQRRLEPVHDDRRHRLAGDQAAGLVGQDEGHAGQQQADGDGGGPIRPGDLKQAGGDHAYRREAYADQRRGILQQHGNQAGVLGGPNEAPQAQRRAANDALVLPVADAERGAFEDGGHRQHAEADEGGDHRLGPQDVAHPLVDRQHPAQHEHHQGDDERPEIGLHAVAERVAFIRRPLAPTLADQQEQLVAGVDQRVDRLGQHGRRAGEARGDELCQRDGAVPGQGGQDDPRRALGRAPFPPRPSPDQAAIMRERQRLRYRCKLGNRQSVGLA